MNAARYCLWLDSFPYDEDPHIPRISHHFGASAIPFNHLEAGIKNKMGTLRE